MHMPKPQEWTIKPPPKPLSKKPYLLRICMCLSILTGLFLLPHFSGWLLLLVLPVFIYLLDKALSKLYQDSIQFHQEYRNQPQFVRLNETDLSYFIGSIGSGSLKYEDMISLEYEYIGSKPRMIFLKIHHTNPHNPQPLKILLNTIQQPDFDAQLRHRLRIFRALRKYELI